MADAFLEEVAGVIGGGLKRGLAVVNALFAGAGDGVIFDAGESALAVSRHVGLDIVVIEIESDIAVEVAIAKVTGIPFFLAPDLPGGIEVAPKGGEAVGREYGGKDAVTGARCGEQNSVRVGDEPANAGFLQD